VEWQREVGGIARGEAKAGGATDGELLGMDEVECSIRYLVGELVGGKSVEEFVEQEGLDWPMLSAWIKSDEKLSERYRDALGDRKVLRHERLLDGWWRKARVEVSDELLTHSDQNKAMENLAKAEGLFSVGDGRVKGSVTITFDDVDAKA